MTIARSTLGRRSRSLQKGNPRIVWQAARVFFFLVGVMGVSVGGGGAGVVYRVGTYIYGARAVS